ncbi:YubN [Escherichia coli]|nr:YubN [Escherichia coli]
MTFCGDLLFVPSGINHHLFENLRRMGHHCHGRKRLSGGRPQKFLPAFGQKLLRDVHFTPGLAETVVAVYAPGDRGLNRCMAPDTTTGRDPPQRRRAHARNGVAPYIPAAFCRDARSAGHGATGTVAASPVVRVRDGSPPGRRQLRWLRSRQPAPSGGRPGKAQAEEEQDRQESGQQ